MLILVSLMLYAPREPEVQGLPKKNTHAHFILQRKSIFSVTTILPVNIGYMCVSNTAKYLSQAHFCSGESEVERGASIFGDDKPSSIYAHYTFQPLDGCDEKRGNNHNQKLVQPILERKRSRLYDRIVIIGILREIKSFFSNK